MKKYILYLFGLNILAIGIVLNLKTGLGVAALSSTIYVCSIIFSISLGLSSIIWYLFFILIQSILCKKIKKEFLLEIPLSIVFGFLTDFYSFLFQSIEFNYPVLVLITLYFIRRLLYNDYKSSIKSRRWYCQNNF